MDIKNKKTAAIYFINRILTVCPKKLNEHIVNEAGEELAQFFLSYSANLIAHDPERVLENTSSLMLMGYLIRANEEAGGSALVKAKTKAKKKKKKKKATA